MTKPSYLHGIFPRSLLLSLSGVVLALGAFAFTVIHREQDMLMENLAARAELLAASVDRVTAEAVVEEEYSTVVDQYLKMVQSRHEIRYAVVSNQKDGSSNLFVKKKGEEKALWTFDNLAGPFWQPKSRESRYEIVESAICGERVLHYWYPFSYSGIDWGWIHVGISLDEYHANTRSLYRIIILLAIPGLMIGVGMSFAFAKRLTDPISILQQFAQQVAAGDLTHRVTVNSNDELGDLAESMNIMTSEIEASVQKEAQLREKDVLLKEIHHRVKNNMQILSSLLRLQARKVPSEEMKSVLRDSESRIRSMGLIHERLYQDESLSDVDFSGYVRALVQELQRMYREIAAGVKVEFMIGEVRLGLDTALPCGLIINELVSNSLKYGFPSDRSGTIYIEVKYVQDSKLLLVVRDDGVGAQTADDLQRDGSLGGRLVSMLSEQLNGDLSIETKLGGGVKTSLEFSETQYKKRV